jgi:nicotinamide-nucleotide amidase
MTVDVRLTAVDRSRSAATRRLDRLERVLRRRLGAAVYGCEQESLEEVVGRALARRRLTLAVAESCTGGLVSDRLTNVPGSSRYLLMGVVAYHNRIKADVLGVPPSLLLRDGAVSPQAAQAMAKGIRARAGADLGLAVTGIAGPTGAAPTKPVGLVYLALADARTTQVRRCQFHGDRLAIKHQTAQLALDWLRRIVD